MGRVLLPFNVNIRCRVRHISRHIVGHIAPTTDVLGWKMTNIAVVSSTLVGVLVSTDPSKAPPFPTSPWSNLRLPPLAPSQCSATQRA